MRPRIGAFIVLMRADGEYGLMVKVDYITSHNRHLSG